MFPIVMLVVNVASRRACSGSAATGSTPAQMQIGALTAFLSYLMQILMSVMMATFMLMMIPRAAVCADRIVEVLDTDDLGRRRPPTPVTDARRARRRSSFDGVEFTYPGAEAPVLRDVSLPARPGQTVAVIGSTGAGKTTLVNLVPRLFDVTAGAVRGRRRRRTPTSSPELLWSRIGLVPQKAYLFSGTVAQQPAARQARRHRRRALGRRSRSPRPRLRRGDARGARRADRPGRHQRLRRPAAAARDRPGARTPPGDLPVRRLVLGARPGHRRPAARGAAPGHHATRRS